MIRIENKKTSLRPFLIQLDVRIIDHEFSDHFQRRKSVLGQMLDDLLVEEKCVFATEEKLTHGDHVMRLICIDLFESIARDVQRSEITRLSGSSELFNVVLHRDFVMKLEVRVCRTPEQSLVDALLWHTFIRCQCFDLDSNDVELFEVFIRFLFDLGDDRGIFSTMVRGSHQLNHLLLLVASVQLDEDQFEFSLLASGSKLFDHFVRAMSTIESDVRFEGAANDVRGHENIDP